MMSQLPVENIWVLSPQTLRSRPEREYSGVSHLQMLKRNFDPWPLAWGPFDLQLHHRPLQLPIWKSRHWRHTPVFLNLNRLRTQTMNHIIFWNESHRSPLQAAATRLQRLQCIPLGQVWPSKLPPLKVLFCLTTSWKWFPQRETFLLNNKICFVSKSQRRSSRRSRGLKHEL